MLNFFIDFCYVAILIGHVTGIVRPSVSLLSRKTKRLRKKLVGTFPSAGVTDVPFSVQKVEGQRVVTGGRPHNMSALGRHIFPSYSCCVVIFVVPSWHPRLSIEYLALRLVLGLHSVFVES